MPGNDFPLVAVLVGWPMVIMSIALVLAGVVGLRAQVALAGAILGCPFLLYLFASPRVRWLSLLDGVLYLDVGGVVLVTQPAHSVEDFLFADRIQL